MEYPDWAPHSLVDYHLGRLEYEDEANREDENLFRSMLPQATEKERRGEGDHGQISSCFAPPKSASTLLETLLTDLRMKSAWQSIGRRIKEDEEFIHFWIVCRNALWMWQGQQKLSRTERKQFFSRIHDLAVELNQMMSETVEYKTVPISSLIELKKVEALMQELSVPPPEPGESADSNIKIVRHIMAEAFPSVTQILDHVAHTSSRYSKEEPVVKKPNSDSAAIHYFVRWLSGYLQKRYGQPLHEVVAATAGVLLEKENVDSVYVRKLLKTQSPGTFLPFSGVKFPGGF
jgi:hypothetical protein